jgi:hypothetical protein
LNGGWGSMEINIMALEDAVRERNALQYYNTAARMLEDAENMKKIMARNTQVKWVWNIIVETIVKRSLHEKIEVFKQLVNQGYNVTFNSLY